MLESEADNVLDELIIVHKTLYERSKIEIRNTLFLEVRDVYSNFILSTVEANLDLQKFVEKQKSFYAKRILQLETELEELKIILKK